MSSSMVVSDVRVRRSADRSSLIEQAAISSVKFLRRQAELSRPESKDEMVKTIWKLYFRARRNGLLKAPKTTKRMLREKYGFWTVVGVVSPS